MPEVVGEAGILLAPDNFDGWVNALESVTIGLEKYKGRTQAETKPRTSFNWGASTGALIKAYNQKNT
jgi:glycosyltransferase involved in cell wall biosynthesis